MQDLHTFLKGRSKQDFAKEVKIVPAYLSQILSGDRIPSFALMVRIENATSGKVPVGAWVKPASKITPQNEGATT